MHPSPSGLGTPVGRTRSLTRPRPRASTTAPGAPRTNDHLRGRRRPGEHGGCHAERLVGCPGGRKGASGSARGFRASTSGRVIQLHRARQTPTDHPHTDHRPKQDRPIIAVSVAGGDNQDQVTLQLLLDLIDFGMLPADAVTAPRFLTPHFLGSFLQAPPKLGSLDINPEVGDAVVSNSAPGATS